MAICTSILKAVTAERAQLGSNILQGGPGVAPLPELAHAGLQHLIGGQSPRPRATAPGPTWRPRRVAPAPAETRSLCRSVAVSQLCWLDDCDWCTILNLDPASRRSP